jgi:hypothetical protein
MRKATIALGTVGIGAGIWYAFGRAREKSGGQSLTKNVNELSESRAENQFLTTSASRSDTISQPKGASEAPLKVDRSDALKEGYEIDDRGTDHNLAVEILSKIKDDLFDSSDEKLALALGRPVEEIQAWAKGEQTIDSDVLMKARALALERGLSLKLESTTFGDDKLNATPK